MISIILNVFLHCSKYCGILQQQNKVINVAGHLSTFWKIWITKEFKLLSSYNSYHACRKCNNYFPHWWCVTSPILPLIRMIIFMTQPLDSKLLYITVTHSSPPPPHLKSSTIDCVREMDNRTCPKVKPKHLDHHLGVGLSIGHNPLLRYFKSDLSQNYNLKSTPQVNFTQRWLLSFWVIF